MIAEGRTKTDEGLMPAWEGCGGLAEAQWVLDQLAPEDRRAVEKMLREPMDFVDHPAFHDPASRSQLEESCETSETDLAACNATLYAVGIFGNTDRVLTAFKPLTARQEKLLFLKLNYIRYQIADTIAAAERETLTPAIVSLLIKWCKAEFAVRSQIAQANIPLVLAMAKRMRHCTVEFSELVGEGCMALLRSIDKFDCSRGFRFSTYACRSILKSFTRLAMSTARYHRRFPVEFDPTLERSDFTEVCRENTRISCMDHLRDILEGESTGRFILSENEKQVLRARFGIHEGDVGTEPMTLEEVGRDMRISKARVRQIQEKAIKKLRAVLEDHVLKS